MKIMYTYNLQTEDSVEQAEYDTQETVDLISQSIVSLGNEVFPVDVGIPIYNLVKKIVSVKPDLIFNTAEGSQGRFREGFYPGLFEVMGIPFTGSSAYVNTLTLDKGLTKMVIEKYRIPTSKWEFVNSIRDLKNVELQYPLIIKPNFEGSSKGIDMNSIVESKFELNSKVKNKLSMFPEGLIIEEYIEGKDIAVPFLEMASPETDGVLPPIEYVVDPRILKERGYNIYDYELKHELNDMVDTKIYKAAKRKIKSIENTSNKIFKALELNDFARIDFRLDADGKLYFLEANALPSLQKDSGIYKSAAELGLQRASSVIRQIITSACKRYGLENKSIETKKELDEFKKPRGRLAFAI